MFPLPHKFQAAKKDFLSPRCQGWACANLDFFFLPGAVSSQVLKKNKFKAANTLYLSEVKVEISLLAVSLCSCGALVGTVSM